MTNIEISIDNIEKSIYNHSRKQDLQTKRTTTPADFLSAQVLLWLFCYSNFIIA
nr:MAG TPA: hypothetical protein [Caudoviricetes sp.]